MAAVNNGGFKDFIRGIGKVRRANGTPSVLAMNAATEEYIALITDSNNQFVIVPEVFNNLKKVVSNQLKEDMEAGSEALIFDPHAMVIGVQEGLVMRIIQDSDYCLKHGAVAFQLYAMLDCAVVQPKHICKITGIK